MATNSSKLQEYTSTSKYVFPPVVALRSKADFPLFNTKLMEIAQALGMTEEVVYSISLQNSDLQKTFELRFAGVAAELRAPLTGYMTADYTSPSAGPPLTGRGLHGDTGTSSIAGSRGDSSSSTGSGELNPKKQGGNQEPNQSESTRRGSRGQFRSGVVFQDSSSYSRGPQPFRTSDQPNEYEHPSVEAPGDMFSTPMQIRPAVRSFSSPSILGTQLPPLPQSLKNFLGVTRADEKLIHTSEQQFINMLTWTKEAFSKRKPRAEMWLWMRKCLFLDFTKHVRGPFASALEGVHLNDICLLLTKVKKLCTRPNIVLIARSVAEFFLKKGNLGESPAQFFITTKEKADAINQSLEVMERERGNTKLTGGFRITDFVSTCMTLNTISKDPKFEHLMFNLAEDEESLSKVMESSENFIKYIDDYQLNLMMIRGDDPPLTAALADMGTLERRPSDACWKNFTGVYCRPGCKFKHYKKAVQPVEPPRPAALGTSRDLQQRTGNCIRCGELRSMCPDTSKCTALLKTCTGCKKVGHVVAVCRARKASLSALRANFADACFNEEEPEEQKYHLMDFGDELEDYSEDDAQCNLCEEIPLPNRVTDLGDEFFEEDWDSHEEKKICSMCEIEGSPVESRLIILRNSEKGMCETGSTSLNNCVNQLHLENPSPSSNESCNEKRILSESICNAAGIVHRSFTKYIADTGTNVTINNSEISPDLLYHEPSSISLAGSGSKIVSATKCDLLHKLRGGQTLEVIKVVNSKEARNLISVPNCTKAGLTFVYDEDEMRVFLTKGLKVDGELIDREDKCPVTGLYPWTMENCDQEEPSKIMFCANAIAADTKPRTSTERLQILREAFSEMVPPATASKLMASHLMSNLARAYTDRAQDENSRNHENLCHMGSKIINAVFPSCKYPSGGCACQECVDAKSHRIPKPRRLDNRKDRNLKAGERSQADFQGPFAGPCGGRKYALEFIDIPSGYGDTYSCKSPTDFYVIFPIHWSESWAASGNRMRFFETDTDSVFLSKESMKIFQDKVVSHSNAAPYEHCPHIEAQNRIRFEAVGAMLKKSNGKSLRWPQARKHLLFTLNNIKIVKMADGTLISRRNVFENNTSVFNPIFFVAFGTKCKVQIPAVQRDGGKGPTQVRTYDGAIVGYMKSGLGYLVEHSVNKKTYQVGLTMVTVFPGVYPWNESTADDAPKEFYPTFEAALDEEEWKRFNFTEAEATKALDRIQEGLVPIVSTYLETEKQASGPVAAPKLMPNKLIVSTDEKQTDTKTINATVLPTLGKEYTKLVEIVEQPSPTILVSSSVNSGIEAVAKMQLASSTQFKEDGAYIVNPGELVCSKIRKPKRNQRIYVLEKEVDDGSGMWCVIEADVLPRVKNPNATKVGHERCSNAKDPLDIWDVPRDNIDFLLEDAIVRCAQSNNPLFAGLAKLPLLEEVFESTIQPIRFKSSESQTFSASTNPRIFSDKPVSLPPPREWEIKSHPFAEFYLEAGDKEFDAVEANGTWALVDITAVPARHKIIPTKMIFSDKVKDNVCLRAKGRLVAQGNHQATNSFGETYAGVMDINGFRIQLAELIQSEGMQAEHWDSSNAYLNGVLEEEVYGMLPPRYRSRYPGKCCRFLKAIYGLRQGGNVWKKLTNYIMIKAGGKANAKDSCVFEIIAAEFWLRVFTVVDDFFVFFEEASRHLRDNLWRICTENIREINNLGEISWALKCTIQIDRPGGILKFSQGGFVREILSRFKLEDIKHSETPAFDTGADAKMTPEDFVVTNEDKESLSKLPIKELIGCFWWLAKMTRGDICIATHQASRYQSKPSFKLWRWILKIAAYLAGSKDVGLIYLRDKSAEMRSAFCDASLGDLPNSKSTLGLVYFVWKCLVHWSSASSSRVYLSSCEAEANAIINLRKFDQWVVLFMFYQCGTLHPGLPTYVGEDNTSTIALSSGSGPMKKSKHYSMEWDALVEAISMKELVLVYTQTDDQMADMFTKPLGKIKFHKFREQTMGMDEHQGHFDRKLKEIV